MIQIDKTAFLDNQKIPLSYKNALKKYGIPKSKSYIKEEVYQKAKPRLIEVCHDKCVFCELKSGHDKEAAYDVEHYRPKRGVTEAATHEGYFWLAHEWTNLLLSCQTCNRIYKKNHFPIVGIRTNNILPTDNTFIGDYNIIEQPLLLNPIFDNINEHIIFVKNGKIKGLTNKGRKSVNYYGLNRDGLVHIRKQILLSIQKKILFLYKYDIPDEKMIKYTLKEIFELKLLDKIENPKTSLIGFRIAILKNFINFVIKSKIYIDNGEPIEIPQQEIWEKYTNELLKISI